MKAIREIIKIDEEKCDGCGLCIPACPEGALQLIDGKARLVSDLMCDGLGACLGECPLDAIIIEKREAEPYNESEVIKVIAQQGRNTTLAHLKHLHEHGHSQYFDEAMFYLQNNRNSIPFDPDQLFNQKSDISAMEENTSNHPGCGCPGAATKDFRNSHVSETGEQTFQKQISQLRQWPIQLHLINPLAPYFKNCELLLAADCVAFAIGDFHNAHLKGSSIAIACPKLDSNQGIYVNKLISLIDDSQVNTITVMIMEVPCCSGLLHMAMAAVQSAKRKVPVKLKKVSLRGDILAETWI